MLEKQSNESLAQDLYLFIKLYPLIKTLESLESLRNHNALLQKACDERLAVIKKLHFEIQTNRYLDLSLLLKKLDAFLGEANKLFDLVEIPMLADHPGPSEQPYALPSLIEKLRAQLEIKYLKIIKEKNKIIEHQQRLIYSHKSMIVKNTVLNRILHFKKRLKWALTPKLGNLVHYPPQPIEIPKHYAKRSKKPNPSQLPVISIVTPTFKQGIFLERTIKSVIEQTYPHLEYIVQDGGGDHYTIKILKKYEYVIKHWESLPDSGQSHALNLGFRHANGDILGYLNSDDLLLPGSLHYIGKFFAKNPKVDVVYGHRVLIDENDLEIGRWVLPPHDSNILSWADYIPQETLFWRKNIWQKVGAKIDESFRFAMDWDLILRFREAGARFARLPRFIGAFRIHPHQKTSSHLSETGMDEMTRLRERCHGPCITMDDIRKNIRSYLYKHLFYHRLYRLGLLKY